MPTTPPPSTNRFKKFIVKPDFSGQGGGGFVADRTGTVVIKDNKGNVLETHNLTNPSKLKVSSQAIQKGLQEGYTIEQNGQVWRVPKNAAGQRIEYDFGNEQPLNVGGKGSSGAPGGGGTSGDSTIPFDPGDFPEFPGVTFNPISTQPIEAAPYQFTDPIEFGKKFGDFNREQIKQNFQTSTEFASKALNNELEGLKSFVPAASALAREQTSIDNQFNQAQRAAQIKATLPGAQATYDRLGAAYGRQADRAELYAKGELPFADRAFELGARSRAADIAGYSGIGPRSMQAQKLSDLMSAEQRLGIAQFGEQLVGSNIAGQENLIGNQANLFLAPTEYSQAGSQVRVTPEVGAGRLTYQGLSEINQATLVPPATALQTEVQQQQFGTQLEQRTREYNSQLDFNTKTFNANGLFQESQINAAGQFQAGIGQFVVDENVKAQITAANQANLNAALAAAIAGNKAQAFGDAQQVQSISDGLTAIGGLGAAGGGSNILGSSSDSGGTSQQPQQNQQKADTEPSTTPETTQPAAQTQTTGTTAQQVTPSSVDTGSAPAPVSTYPAGTTIPAGQIPVGTTADGGTMTIPDDSYRAEMKAFAENHPEYPPIDTGSAVQVDQQIAKTTGLTYQPTNGYQQIALTQTGKQVYSLPAAAQSGNTNRGAENVSTAGIMASYLGVDDPRVYEALARTGGAATLLSQGEISDAVLYNNLTSIEQKKISQGELTTQNGMLIDKNGNRVNISQRDRSNFLLKSVAGKDVDLNTKAGQQLAFGAHRIAELWPNLSPGQRSLAVSALSQAAVEHKTGEALSTYKVPGTDKSISGPLTVGAVNDVLKDGNNGYALARNWNQLSSMAAMQGEFDHKDPRVVARLGAAYGMLGEGPSGAAVKVDTQKLRASGARPMPEMGIGAMNFTKQADVPSNYKVLTTTPDHRIVAIPKNLEHTSPISKSSNHAHAHGHAFAVAARKHPAQKLWGPDPSRGTVRGAAGGSAIVSGMNTMLEKNPYLAGSIYAHSFYNNQLGG